MKFTFVLFCSDGDARSKDCLVEFVSCLPAGAAELLIVARPSTELPLREISASFCDADIPTQILAVPATYGYINTVRAALRQTHGEILVAWDADYTLSKQVFSLASEQARKREALLVLPWQSCLSYDCELGYYLQPSGKSFAVARDALLSCNIGQSDNPQLDTWLLLVELASSMPVLARGISGVEFRMVRSLMKTGAAALELRSREMAELDFAARYLPRFLPGLRFDIKSKIAQELEGKQYAGFEETVYACSKALENAWQAGRIPVIPKFTATHDEKAGHVNLRSNGETYIPFVGANQCAPADLLPPVTQG